MKIYGCDHGVITLWTRGTLLSIYLAFHFHIMKVDWVDIGWTPLQDVVTTLFNMKFPKCTFLWGYNRLWAQTKKQENKHSILFSFLSALLFFCIALPSLKFTKSLFCHVLVIETISGQKQLISKLWGQQDNFLYWSIPVKRDSEAKTRMAVVWGEDDWSSLTSYQGERRGVGYKCIAVKNTKVRRGLMGSVTLMVLGIVDFLLMKSYHGDPRKVWSSLHERYSARTTFNKASVHSTMAWLRYTGQYIQKFVANWELCYTQLASINSLIYTGLSMTMFNESIWWSSKVPLRCD